MLVCSIVFPTPDGGFRATGLIPWKQSIVPPKFKRFEYFFLLSLQTYFEIQKQQHITINRTKYNFFFYIYVQSNQTNKIKKIRFYDESVRWQHFQ